MTIDHWRISATPLAFLLITIGACSGRIDERNDTAATDSASHAASGRETTAIVPDPLPEVAAPRMRWDIDAVAAALDAGGLERRAGPHPVTESFLSAPGHRLIFIERGGGEAEIQAFIYGDAGAVARDLAGLDTVRVAPRSRGIEWRVPATLITDNNLILILLTESPQIRETVRKAILRP